MTAESFTSVPGSARGVLGLAGAGVVSGTVPPPVFGSGLGAGLGAAGAVAADCCAAGGPEVAHRLFVGIWTDDDGVRWR